MRWERLVPLACIAIILALGYTYVVGDSLWEPDKKDYTFPGGRLRPPRWPSRTFSTAPFNGYVSWAPDDRGEATMSLGWHYAAASLDIETVRRQALAIRLDPTLAGGGRGPLLAASLEVSREKPVLVDGHNGSQLLLTDTATRAVVGAVYSWHCPTTRRQFLLRMLQAGPGGAKVPLAERAFTSEVRCHEAGVEPEDFERRSYRLASDVYTLQVLRPCVHQYRHAKGPVAFTVYWYPARLTVMSAEEALAEGTSMARSLGLDHGPWRPSERAVGDHQGWECVLPATNKDLVLRILMWNCEQTGKSYEMVSAIEPRSEGGPFDPWQSATRIECH